VFYLLFGGIPEKFIISAGRTAHLTRRAALHGTTASICRGVPRGRGQRNLGEYRAGDDCDGHVGRLWRLLSAKGRALELSSSYFRSYYLTFLQ
jgi:hypothetical protein